ncbi:AraC family transcriptional regulator [Clostridium arbusti]|uniref:AraC family transcriptional regulator n=1 Tax=Clostridium arbusti TaxID=1137848 RepID=UPI000289F13A|nr:AraC family transcriptional regulator [Clostridium arbusti]
MKLLTLNADIIPSVRLIGHVSYNKPWKHFTRTIDEYLLYIVKSGELYIKEGTTEYCLKKGDLLILEPNIKHYGFKESICHYYYFHFKHPNIEQSKGKSCAEILNKLIENRKHALASDHFSKYEDVSHIFYLPKFYHYESENEIIPLLINADNDFYKKYEGYKKIASINLLKILIKISRDYISSKIDTNEKHFSKAFIKSRKLLNYLNNYFMNKITREDIEQLFESNYDYLNRTFQNITGYTILNYLNTIRITKAKELFDTTPIKISEVGYLVGIGDPYYFSRFFKKNAGMTPSQYIKLRSETKLE